MVVETGETMPKLIETARTLRQVRRMQTEFLLRWSLQRASQHRLSDPTLDCDPTDPMADPTNRDWRNLYRGDILDD